MGYALPSERLESRLASGTVRACEGDALLVQGACGLVRAVRAEGCLLMPEPRDTVLLALLDSGEAWVLSVLRRHGGDAALRLPETTTLEAATLNLHAESVRIEGRQVDIRAGLLAFGGQVLVQGFAVVRTFARSLGERVFRRRGDYGSLSETVEDLAECKAGRVRTDSRTSYRVRAESADIRAQAHMDLDAEHIKVG